MLLQNNSFMKNLFNKIIVAISFFCMFGFVSCNEYDYLKFDISQSGIYFTKDTLKYSFSVTPLAITEYEFKVPFRILGGLSGSEREVAYRINPEYTTAEIGKHCNIGRAVVLPDSIDGYIPVTILRDNLEGNYNDGYECYSLCIELAQNENFTPTLDSLSQVRILQFDNAIDTPEWFISKSNDKVWVPGRPHENLGSWHPYTFIKLVEQFQTVKDVPNMEATYDKMVELYGEYLEKVPIGSFHDYMPVIRKYVLGPLYEYFNNPDEVEKIKSLYPDYPFDFPNPYGN